MQKRATKRNWIIDIYRFLFALVIMTGHAVNVGMEAPFPFAGVGIFVEFFYLITGYFTLNHISNKIPFVVGDRMLESLRYTFRKFSVFLPYLAISVSARHLYDFCYAIKISGWGGTVQALKSLLYAPLELFLTNYIFSGVPQKVGALYYLAAMIVVLPLFCLLCMCKNNSIKLGIALYAMLFYYYDVDWAITASYPQVLFRAFCGMCMGVVIDYAVKELKYKDFIVKHKMVVIVFGNLLLIVSMMLSGLSLDNRRIQLICVFMGVLSLFLASEYFAFCGNVFTSYLAKLSMVIYIMHWTVGVIINGVMSDNGLAMKMITYYVLTVLISVLMIHFVERKQS